MVHKECRLCGTSSSENMINIFTKDDKSVQYITKIKSCIPILIYRSDPLSKVVCSSCGLKIDDFYQFKNVVNENNIKAIEALRLIQDDERVQLYLNGLDNSSLDNLNGLDDEEKSITKSRRAATGEKIASPSSPASSSKIFLSSDLQLSRTESDSTSTSSFFSTPQPLLKILTPNNINSSVMLIDNNNLSNLSSHLYINNNINDSNHSSLRADSSNSMKNCVISSAANKIIKRVQHQPKTLLQLALHIINLSINSNYLSEESMRLKIFAKNRDYINFERRWKLSLSSRSVNKRTFDECRPVLNNLLNSWKPPIKQIKLESVNPLAPEICISLKDNTHILDVHDENRLDIRLKYPQNRCRYCFKDFCNIQQLALHEASSHIQVFIGARIDSDYWRDYDENMVIRKKWLERKDEYEVSSDSVHIKEELVSDEEADQIDNNEEETMNEEQDEEGETNGDMEESMIEKPQEEHDVSMWKPLDVEVGKVGDTPFHNLSKKERFQYYKIVYESGLKRRQCPFCKRSFKDSWSVDDHILKNRCRLICPFCHKYFQKDDPNIFYRHLDVHKYEPNYHSMTKQWRKNMIRAQQLMRSQQMQLAPRFYQQRPFKIEPIKMKYLLERQNNVPHIKTEPGTMPINPTQLLELQYSTGPDPKRVSKPYRSYYCRNCYKVFYQEHDLNMHYPHCCEQSVTTDVDNGGDGGEHSRNEYQTYPESDSAKKQVFRCGFCPAVFYNSNARNSHMRVHKEKIFNRKPPMMSMSQHHQYQAQQQHMLQQQQQKSAPPRLIDENLARLAQNPHITIKPSMKRPLTADEMSSPDMSSSSKHTYTKLNIPHLAALTVPEVRHYQCQPCGTTCAGQKALYEHKKTCPALTGLGPIASHMANDRKDSSKKFRCTGCNKRFMTKANLSFHRKNVCTRCRVFECPFCKRKFSTQSQYTNHILYNHPE